jgi:hypothetical protein
MDSLQELTIREIMQVRMWRGLSLVKLSRLLRDEILRRECMQRFDNVLEELFSTIMNTAEWRKLYELDTCIRPSVLSRYRRAHFDDEEWIETPYYSGRQLEPHPWDLLWAERSDWRVSPLKDNLSEYFKNYSHPLKQKKTE